MEGTKKQYNVREWKEMPSDEELETALNEWLDCNGRKAPFVGICRDGRNEISEKSVFHRSEDDHLTIAIGQKLKKILQSMGLYEIDDEDETTPGCTCHEKKKNKFIVFLTFAEELLWACPIYGCYVMRTAAEWERHARTHQCIMDVRYANHLLNLLGIEPMRINYHPRPLGHTITWKEFHGAAADTDVDEEELSDQE
jgi:hypothetical protein